MNTQQKLEAIATFIHEKLSASVVMVTSFVSIMLLTVCIFWYTMTHALDNYLSQQTEVLGSSLATQAAFNATQSILTNDLLSLNILLNRLVVDDNILSARVYNKKDELLAEADSGSSSGSSEQDFRPNEQRSVYSSSIKFRDEIVGHVLITLDKTPAQTTLKHLNQLLLGVAIFVGVITLLLIALLSKWLFAPINQVAEVLTFYKRGKRTAPLPTAKYREAKDLCDIVADVQKIEPVEPIIEENPQEEVAVALDKLHKEVEAAQETQFEINFDAIFEESSQRNCVLYFSILNLDDWHQNLPPLQVSNLLTPVYRAIFQASDIYLGQVHQYQSNSAIILFSATDSEDKLYMNAVSTAQLFLGLMETLFENELYEDIPKLNFHLGLHQGNPQVAGMFKDNIFVKEEVSELLENTHLLSHTESVNKLVISEEIFTLPEIQNRVFSGLPEIIEVDEQDMLAYEVKGIAEKYKLQVQNHIEEITEIES
ncbi:AhpA/YtjB family protein [Marinomonas sp. C2222]|uniref:AhpA/YtjB family protein n=1 Tax=Marinomonas sargassi TaxID=2984494 RepID=A0ABT2YN11_9GAMM|nr:AhpA/YtjB family protein [Marinomonas sargassi]MCV2401280.1 AhpA/YtjB family protein [Marinomonas sargassi]